MHQHLRESAVAIAVVLALAEAELVVVEATTKTEDAVPSSAEAV